MEVVLHELYWLRVVLVTIYMYGLYSWWSNAFLPDHSDVYRTSPAFRIDFIWWVQSLINKYHFFALSHRSTSLKGIICITEPRPYYTSGKLQFTFLHFAVYRSTKKYGHLDVQDVIQRYYIYIYIYIYWKAANWGWAYMDPVKMTLVQQILPCG